MTKMNRYYTMMFAAALTGACAIQAQAADTLSMEAKQNYNQIKNNILKMAEGMPEENYGFKATPDVRTFGQLIGHIADAQMGTCSAVNGEMKQLGASSKTSKADLVAALKQSNDECDKSFAGLTDESATQMVKTRRGERSKLGTLTGVVIHDNEEYGYTAVYMRLKGLTPPSSAK
jgi:hypothetical protein